MPVTGFHSTIDKPDSVSRVAPPTSSVTNISAATASSHSRMARRRDGRQAECRTCADHRLRRTRGPYSPAPCPRNRRSRLSCLSERANSSARSPCCRPGHGMGAARDGVRAVRRRSRRTVSSRRSTTWSPGSAGCCRRCRWCAGCRRARRAAARSTPRRRGGSRSRPRSRRPTAAHARSATADARR